MPVIDSPNPYIGDNCTEFDDNDESCENCSEEGITCDGHDPMCRYY